MASRRRAKHVGNRAWRCRRRAEHVDNRAWQAADVPNTSEARNFSPGGIEVAEHESEVDQSISIDIIDFLRMALNCLWTLYIVVRTRLRTTMYNVHKQLRCFSDNPLQHSIGDF
ncbi:unnamed protein product [Heligmosomoides polygyrus]|uniref:Uncharacterized protein n=1 Tax=Heligmosomoides polygyrus TaxID=6339 RepID=A0A183FTX2_HELPZ|nr:unnamed protein product [Heligmosomoides polygyrus]